MHIVNHGTIDLDQPLTKKAIEALKAGDIDEDVIAGCKEGEWEINIDEVLSSEFDGDCREMVRILAPMGYVLNGTVKYYGDYEGSTYIEDNVVDGVDIVDTWRHDTSDDDLIAELGKRGYGVFNKRGTYRDVIKAILPITCKPYVSDIYETNQIDVGAADFFNIKAPKTWWDAPYGSYEGAEDEDKEADS